MASFVRLQRLGLLVAEVMMVGMESLTVETGDGVKLHARLFKPAEPPANDLVVVFVHPYTVLGGSQGLLKGIATGLAERGFRVVTFDMRCAGRASLFGSAEIQDAIAVCKWVSNTLAPRDIILVGSSAGNSPLQISNMTDFSWWIQSLSID